MNTLFIPSGPPVWASSRFRMYWPAKYMQGVDILDPENRDTMPLDYDKYVFQKWLDYPKLKTLHETGKKLFWDMCDPVWWWQPQDVRPCADLMTKVICSSEGLTEDFNQWYGRDLAVCIPDRLELSHYPLQRQHADVTPVRFIWFGIAANRIALWGGLANLERLVSNGYKIELTICDDRPEIPFQGTNLVSVYHIPWSLEKENEIISSHDVALLPPYPGAWGKVKSNNKALTAWACGLPVTDGQEYNEVEWLIQAKNRRLEWRMFDHRWHEVELSARELEAVLNV